MFTMSCADGKWREKLWRRMDKRANVDDDDVVVVVVTTMRDDKKQRWC